MNRVRLTHHLLKELEKSYRPYEKQPETPYGQYAQADFGDRWMRTPHGGSLKVYFLAMSLSRSRYKFVYFSRTPFTTALAVYAHELAFEFFGGVPRKIVYDRDKVFLVKENLGDPVLTGGFRTLVREHGFEPVFCRKSAPESKAKIENVVKYVKYNFLRGREFTDIDRLNKEVLGWLEEKEGRLHIYSHETGKTLGTHRISGDKGRLISNTSHRRDLESSLNHDLLSREVQERDSKDFQRRLKAAAQPTRHDPELFDHNYSQGITAPRLRELRRLGWLEQNYNLILMGPSGTGKTFIAAGLVYEAVRQAYKA